MDISPLFLARAQFVSSLSFLAFFLAVALALAWVLLFFKLRARYAKQPAWITAYRFWVRIFALSFVLALAAAVPLLIQFGSLWGSLMDKIGNVAGPLIGYGVLSVFILKSCFLGVMLFGQRRVADGAHTVAVFMVATGQLIAVFWIVALQSWMQTPDGAVIVDGRYQVYDWLAVIFNASVGWRIAQTLVGAALCVAFLMLGVTALQALRRPLEDGEKRAFKAALILAVCASALQIPVGIESGKMAARYQPAKAAAAMGYWHSSATPELVLFAWPDKHSHENLGAITLSNRGGSWLKQDAKGVYQGLDHYAGMGPPVALTFWSLRIAVLLGLLMLAVSWLTLLMTLRKGLDPATLPSWWLRVLIGMMFSGGAAVVVGWWVNVIGSQPYIVSNTITQAEVLGTVSRGVLAWGLGGFAVVYVGLLAAFISMLFYAARYGVVPVRKAGGTS